MTTPPQTTTAPYRTIDGTDNDGRDSGAVDRGLLMPATAASIPFTPHRQPNPRAVSNAVVVQRHRLVRLDDHGRSEFVWAWGQFLDHELDLIRDDGLDAPIPVPDIDPSVEFRGTTIGFRRSGRNPSTQGLPNRHTAYVDASNVYGTDNDRKAALQGTNGRMRTAAGVDGDVLPKNDQGLPNADSGSGSPERFFLAGDVRANEHPVLTALHTLFVREHNRLCPAIEARHPGIGADEIYERARKIVGAQMQAITYNEFLPALLGPDGVDSYTGYRPATDPGISNLFATAAYRLGHSMVRDDVALSIANRRLRLEHVFFTPELIDRLGIDAFLGRLAHRRMAAIDTSIVDGLRQFLFRRDTINMLDLAALNIQRGRDHELPDYNGCRVMMGLAPVADLDVLTRDVALADRLRRVYGGIDGIDPWVGGLAEAPQPGRLLGDLFHEAIVDQFTRLRNGDHYWYENDPHLEASDRIAIANTRLADIIRRNTNLEVPDDVFRVPQYAFL